jgi:cytoskeleton protein RodZ
MRGVSLDEIAESTKIGTRLLRALEEEQFDLLPGGIFNKGFVRAYAKYLGMDEDQAVADYLQAAGNEEPDVQLIAQQGDWAENRYAEPARTSRRGFPFIPVLVLVLVVVAGFGGWRMYQQHMQEKEASQAERETLQASAPSGSTQPTPSDAGQSSAPQPTSGAVVTQPSPAAEQPAALPVANSSLSSPATSSGFEVEVKTTGRAWVSLKADGKFMVRGVLEADQSRTLHADKEVVVWTGNAGATQVSFDGKVVPIEGGANETRVLVFKPSGLQPTPQPSARPATESPTQPTAEPSLTPQ